MHRGVLEEAKFVTALPYQLGVEHLSLENVRRRLTPVFQRYGILKAIVFGSVARGEPSPHSDVDLILIQETTKRFLDRYDGILLDLNEAIPHAAVEGADLHTGGNGTDAEAAVHCHCTTRGEGDLRVRVKIASKPGGGSTPRRLTSRRLANWPPPVFMHTHVSANNALKKPPRRCGSQSERIPGALDSGADRRILHERSSRRRQEFAGEGGALGSILHSHAISHTGCPT